MNFDNGYESKRMRIAMKNGFDLQVAFYESLAYFICVVFMDYKFIYMLYT